MPGPASATVTVVKQTVVLRVLRSTVQAKLDGDSGFASRFYKALAVFLAHRLRQSTARLGYGDARDLEEDTADELSPELLDQLAVAGKRSEWILERMRGK